MTMRKKEEKEYLKIYVVVIFHSNRFDQILIIHYSLLLQNFHLDYSYSFSLQQRKRKA
jgi:hypothetical protein